MWLQLPAQFNTCMEWEIRNNFKNWQVCGWIPIYPIRDGALSKCLAAYLFIEKLAPSSPTIARNNEILYILRIHMAIVSFFPLPFCFCQCSNWKWQEVKVHPHQVLHKRYVNYLRGAVGFMRRQAQTPLGSLRKASQGSPYSFALLSHHLWHSRTTLQFSEWT